MKNFKHAASFLLLVVFIALALGSTGSTPATTSDGVQYDSERDFKIAVVNVNYAEITDYVGSKSVVNIPLRILGRVVIGIRDNAFANNTVNETITSITLSKWISSIGGGAFNDCTNLTSIIVAADNKDFTTEDGILYNKDKSTLIRYPQGKTDVSFTIPDIVISIGDFAFASCKNLASVTIPDSVTSIGSAAFAISGLTSVTIPTSVNSIGEMAFRYCENLASVIIPNSVTGIENYTFANCTTLTSVTIPNSVTSIGNAAFRNCTSLASIIIPNSVNSIGSLAFSGCTSLTRVTIPSSVNSIGGGAFHGCTSLTSVIFEGTIPSNRFSGDPVASDFETSMMSPVFFNDLRAKYLAGGPGTYTRASGGSVWTKQ